jgi:hypothetical protein
MKTLLTLFLFSTLFLVSCKKEAGEGGTSSITGRIMERNYAGSFPAPFYTEYGAQAEDVYIIYGTNDTIVGDRVKTSYNGEYEFKYLQKGSYTIFVYSDDTNFVAPSPSGKVVVKQVVEINDKKSEVNAPDLLIMKL